MIHFIIAAAALAAPETPPAAITTTTSRSVLVIDPKARANDWMQAFDLLRKDKPTAKMMVRTLSGQTLSNISDLSVTQGGTLFMLRIVSNQGYKYQFLPVEELLEVTYSPL
jgi:hypothetical protein